MLDFLGVMWYTYGERYGNTMERTYAIVQTLNYDGHGEWEEMEIVFQSDYAECKEQILKLAEHFKEMYETMYEEVAIISMIDKYSKGTAYRVSCPNNPPLWAEFVIAQISL